MDNAPDAREIETRDVEGAVAAILPEAIVTRLKLREGYRLRVEAKDGGGVALTSFDPVHEQAMDTARSLFVEYADVFRALAK